MMVFLAIGAGCSPLSGISFNDVRACTSTTLLSPSSWSKRRIICACSTTGSCARRHMPARNVDKHNSIDLVIVVSVLLRIVRAHQIRDIRFWQFVLGRPIGHTIREKSDAAQQPRAQDLRRNAAESAFFVL